MSYPGLSILIPAAGASKRLGQAKQLVRYKAGTLVENAVDLALSISPREVIVVTGAHERAVKDAVTKAGVICVHNANWSEGLGSSIATGAAAISPESTGVMVLLCDQWRLQPSDLRKVAERWHSNPQQIICAQVDSQNMPPVIFPGNLLGRLQTLGSEKGARSILNDYPELITPVALENALYDLDIQVQLDMLNTSSL